MKILSCDDHALFRAGLRVALADLDEPAELVEARTCEEGIAAVAADPDIEVVLLDLDLPDRDGWQALKEIRERFPATAVVILSGTEGAAVASRAEQLGASGFVPKSLSQPALIKALSTVIEGDTYFAVPPGAPRAEDALTVVGSLSDRQREVLRLVSRGLTNKEIAATLSVSVSTVKVYVAQVIERLHVTNRTEAAVIMRDYERSIGAG